MTHDVVSNDGVADRLWLFSYGEMEDAVYPSAGFSSDGSSFDAKRSTSMFDWWLRSPDDSNDARSVYNIGNLSNGNSVNSGEAVAPGFTLP